MKLLILSSNNGGGHNSTAYAIKEYYEANGFEVVIRDSLSFLSENVSGIISKSHSLVYRYLPQFADNSVLHLENKTSLYDESHPLRQVIDLGKHHLRNYILEQQFNTVICTHVFGAMILSVAIPKEDRSIHTAFVETDYCNSIGAANNNMDYHFLPHESLKPELIRNGVPEQTLVISGIPVKKRIRHPMDQRAAKKLFGIPEDRFHIILMGGSMGCGPIPELLGLLSERLSDIAHISLICGTNSHLEKQMKDRFSGHNNIHIFGYTDMAILYASADLFVTKPGGISITEAAVLGLPMVLINAVAGWESCNLKFFVDHEAALSGDTEEELTACCELLLRNKDKRDLISSNLLKLSHPDSTEIIFRTLEASEGI